ncbi:nucleotide-binding protein [Piscinibacter defluvii]|uniref:nucleotide-binding protein n=1 Tax=Piscinibacter defluvii TaxID=1796922 RepID=UPI000FDDF07B|nr:nucleotide-binding protein [Piscinibacter defluvii]
MISDKPVIFVASSTERLPVARAIAEALAEPAEWTVRVWDSEFAFSAVYIESLEKALDTADFAVVVMTGDDLANKRGVQVVLPRDNVIFELGLFIGRIGRERCTFFVEHDSSTQIASDLSGVKAAEYWPPEQMTRRVRPGLAERARELKKRIREQLAQHGTRYRPDGDERRRQQQRWQFLRRIEGLWWERMRDGDDDQSALSLVTIGLDPVTNGAVLRGDAYDLDGGRLAEWQADAALQLDDPPTLHYRWQGFHESARGAAIAGQGQVSFDSREAPSSGRGWYYDIRVAEIQGGHAPVREKGVRMRRLDEAEAATMRDPFSAAAQALVKQRIADLRFR